VLIGALTGGNVVAGERSYVSVLDPFAPFSPSLNFRVTGTPVAAGVPDNGSTVMLLGIGVVAIAFASRCRFVVAKSFNARLGL
jgi:VPDSG-CTERM motif